MDRESFMKAICERPEDDAPRLVYADWCEEHGDTARSEFIRLHCERSRLPITDREGRQKLTVRIDQLDEANRAAWLAELPVLKGVEWHDFHRGFFRHAIIMDPDAFLKEHSVSELFYPVPVLTVSFRRLSREAIEKLIKQPDLSKIRVFNVGSNSLGDDNFIRLITCPYLSGVKKLLANGNSLTARSAEAIANAKHLGNLDQLFMPANSLEDQGAQILAASKTLTSIEEVVLTANNLSSAGIDALRKRWGEKTYG